VLTIDLGRGRVVHRTDVGGPARHLGLPADGRRLWTALGNRAAVPSGAVARLVAEPESGAARGAERADRSRRRLGRDDQRPPPPPASPGRALEICREESGAQLAPEAVGALVRPDAQQVAPEAAADGVVPPEEARDARSLRGPAHREQPSHLDVRGRAAVAARHDDLAVGLEGQGVDLVEAAGIDRRDPLQAPGQSEPPSALLRSQAAEMRPRWVKAWG